MWFIAAANTMQLPSLGRSDSAVHEEGENEHVVSV